MSYKPQDLRAFDEKMKEINATKENDPDILRRMIIVERDQAMEIQIKLAGECDRLRALNAELLEALGDLIEDAERQMANPSHHIPFSLPKAKAAIAKSGGPVNVR